MRLILESGKVVEFDMNHPVLVVKYWNAGEWHLDKTFPATDEGRRMATQYMDRSHWHGMSLEYYS